MPDRRGLGCLFFRPGAQEISNARGILSGSMHNEGGELPEDKGIMKSFLTEILPVCISSTGDGENKPDYDIQKRLREERQMKVDGGMTEEVAETLIPALIFLTTNSNESSRTFKEFFRLVINVVLERKGNIYGTATRSTSRILAKSMKQRAGRVGRLWPGAVYNLIYSSRDRDAHGRMEQL